MEKHKYELNSKGVNALVNDYIKHNWTSLTFQGIDGTNIQKIVWVNLLISRIFSGEGSYCFEGEIRPQFKTEEGYFEKAIKVSCYVDISVNQENEPYIEPGKFFVISKK